MDRRTALAALTLASLLGAPARAGLDVGERAPDFTLPAAQAGQRITYSLAAALTQGPVVLVFFPLAVGEGCPDEIRRFAQALPAFEALGASLLGVSIDGIEALARPSAQACFGNLPVASDAAMGLLASFDAAMQTRADHANRISYVIAPDSKVIHSYLGLNAARHVERSLAALRQWHQPAAAAATQR